MARTNWSVAAGAAGGTCAGFGVATGWSVMDFVSGAGVAWEGLGAGASFALSAGAGAGAEAFRAEGAAALGWALDLAGAKAAGGRDFDLADLADLATGALTAALTAAFTTALATALTAGMAFAGLAEVGAVKDFTGFVGLAVADLGADLGADAGASALTLAFTAVALAGAFLSGVFTSCLLAEWASGPGPGLGTAADGENLLNGIFKPGPGPWGAQAGRL